MAYWDSKCDECGVYVEEKSLITPMATLCRKCLDGEDEIDWSCPICGQDPCNEDDRDSMEDVDVEL